ncbi:MAG: hypothetical protein C4520_16380 [Candidatus Abyssobacteria bacterium SURF_5]|uniref:Secreted protein n=1 Tax=Abyssobacteria bacterium (strain SURF_5) TaxID=2093360 RepID=A0A3A4NK41_ABYX5|nr:MAG: hypothetical protein C4520_16380 [Candidatus Abyssubacteria bacterium SURF_5]
MRKAYSFIILILFAAFTARPATADSVEEEATAAQIKGAAFNSDLLGDEPVDRQSDSFLEAPVEEPPLISCAPGLRQMIECLAEVASLHELVASCLYSTEYKAPFSFIASGPDVFAGVRAVKAADSAGVACMRRDRGY